MRSLWITQEKVKQRLGVSDRALEGWRTGRVVNVTKLLGQPLSWKAAGVTFAYWRSHIDTIEKVDNRRGRKLTKRKAIEDFRTSDAELSRLLAAGQLSRTKHVELVPRKGASSMVPVSKVLLDPAELNEHLGHRKPGPPKKVDRLILPSAAEKLTKGAFKKKTMEYWEEHGSPYTGRKLTVEYRVMNTVQQKFGQAVRYVRDGVKHYVRSEILEAYRAYKQAKKKTRGTIKRDGTFYTMRAAMREDGVSQNSLERWAECGWVEHVQATNPDPGAGKVESTYYRRDGETGYLHVAATKKGKHTKGANADEQGSRMKHGPNRDAIHSLGIDFRREMLGVVQPAVEIIVGEVQKNGAKIDAIPVKIEEQRPRGLFDDPATPSVDEWEEPILRALNDAAPRRIDSYDLAEATRIGLKKVKESLNQLQRKGLADREGQRRPWGITAKGKQTLKTIATR